MLKIALPNELAIVSKNPRVPVAKSGENSELETLGTRAGGNAIGAKLKSNHEYTRYVIKNLGAFISAEFIEFKSLQFSSKKSYILLNFSRIRQTVECYCTLSRSK